jgi:hypothetical protein
MHPTKQFFCDPRCQTMTTSDVTLDVSDSLKINLFDFFSRYSRQKRSECKKENENHHRHE